jgi:phospholipid/cholesterol/gamma-HCH transport system substrate-binding protein
MAQRNSTELIAGFVVLAVAAGFLGYAVVHTGRATLGGYMLNARFDHIDGLSVGSDVRLAGVKIGSVTTARVDPGTYQAVVGFTVEPAVKLPKDSSAAITSDGLLGGKFLSLEPGGDEAMLSNGGTVTITQSSVSLEQLLGKFIFSVSDLGSKKQDGSAPGGATPAKDQGGGLAPLGQPAAPK